MKESLFWIVFVIFQTIQPLAGRGLLSLRLVSYSNPDGKTADGSCCEHIFSFFGCSTGDCDPALTICIQDTIQTGSCSVLRYKAGPYDDTGSVSFGTKIGALENPIQIPFQIWKNQFTISIAVYDDDSDGGHDHIGTITLTPNKVPGYNGSNTAYTENFRSGYARIQVQYDIHCLTNYYGQDCITFCKPDGIHYVCDGLGNKVCLSGWTGSDCLASINDCHSLACLNSGICEDLHNAYKCHCSGDFTGSRCEIEIPKKIVTNETQRYTSDSFMAFTDNISTPRTSEREFTAMGNNSSTEQIMDLITVQLSTDTTSLSTKELSSVKTDSELSSTNPAKIAFTTPYEITEDSSVTVTKEEMVFLTPTVVEIISSPNEANENPTPDLMEITPFLNETTPDRKFDVSTFGEIDTFTKSLGINITSNTQTKENESTPVEYNNSITTNTNSLSMNETFITGDITFVTQPNQTMTNPADISKEVEFTIPSTADSQTKFEENTYDVINYDFTSSPNSIISNESFSVLLSTESSRTEQQENKSTVELTSSEMQITSTDGDFQSFSPSKAFNNMTFKHGELVSSPNTLSSDRTNEMTMKTGDVSEILTSSFEANFISGSTIAQLAVTEDLETKQTKDVNVTSVVDLETVYSISKNMNISGIESTLENNSEASSKPSSYELTTIVEEVNSNGLSTASNILNSNDVSSTNYSLLSTLQTSLGITGNETISETLYTSQSEQTFTNKAEFFSTLQSAVENATLPKGAHSTQAQGHFFQNLSRDSLTLDIILSTLPKTVTEAKPSTQFTLQKYSDLSWVSTTQSEPSTNAITQLINLSTNTIKYSSLKTPPTTTEDVNLTEKSDNYMSNTQMGEYSNYTHVSKPQTTLIDVGSQSESSGLSTTKHQQQSTNFLSENVTESTSLPPTNEHPTLPLSVSTSQQAHISFESSISPTTISVFSSSVAKGTPLPSSSTTSVSHTCQSRYFLDKIGELVIEVKSKFKFYVVKKELMDTVGEYEVTDAQVKFNFTFIDNMYIVWMRFDSRTLPLKIIEIREITVKVCNSLQLSSSGTKNVELHKELTSGSFAVIVVALLYFSILLIIAFILIHRKYKQRLKVGSTEYLSEKTCSTRATLETNLEIESEC